MAAVNGRAKLHGLQEWFRVYAEAGLNAFEKAGIGGQLYDVYRSPAEQDRRFKLGDSKARANQSPHQYGLAFDFVCSAGERSDLQRFVQSVWQGWGFGVIDWDPAHVELPNWKQLVRASGLKIP